MRRSSRRIRACPPGWFFARRCSALTNSSIVIKQGQSPMTISRRQILREAATGIGGTALAWILQQDRLRAEQPRTYDLRAKKPDFAPTAKSVIYLYMGGGPSTIDMFDPKPLLKKYDGQD